MKILEVTNTDFALAHFVLPLMRALKANGHDVVGVCADGPLLAQARGEGFRVETPPLARNWSPTAQVRALIALVKLIRREKPDLLHAHMPISGILARIAARICNVPCIAYTCHGFLFNQPATPLPRRLLALVLELICGRMTHVYMTVSREEARDARRLHIHPAPIAIGNGRDSRVFKPDATARQRIRQELGTAETTPVIIIVSRLVHHKGYLELLEAMTHVTAAELWIVGQRLPSDHGPDMAPALSKAQADMGPRLKCLGYRTDIPALLAAADIFTLPSHFEGLPMSVIEAMLCGLPVVSTDIRGPREQVVQGQTGLVVPPAAPKPLAQALNRLVHDLPSARQMGARGRTRALALFEENQILNTVVTLLERRD